MVFPLLYVKKKHSFFYSCYKVSLGEIILQDITTFTTYDRWSVYTITRELYNGQIGSLT